MSPAAAAFGWAVSAVGHHQKWNIGLAEPFACCAIWQQSNLKGEIWLSLEMVKVNCWAFASLASVLILCELLGVGKIQITVCGRESCTEQEWLLWHTKLWEWKFWVRCWHPGTRFVQCFHVHQHSRKLGGGKDCVCIPKAEFYIQKKGKCALLHIQIGVLWAQSSSQEVQFCRNSTMRFSCSASLASAASLLSSCFKHELGL